MHTSPDPQMIQARADEIRQIGYTLIEDGLDAGLISEMLAAFDPLIEAKRASEPTNRGANRYQMHLPFEPPFAHPMLYENPTVLAILENLFGPDYICTYFASDTPFPGSDYQRVHLDCRLPFPETEYGVPVYSVVLNVPLVDFTEENGPLEVWPGGTHLIGQPKEMERIAQQLPSVQVTMKAGSILLRDARMWHRGTPSRGTRSRPNLAVVYSRGWFRFESQPYRIKIPRATYEHFSESVRKMFRYCALQNPDGTLSDVEA